MYRLEQASVSVSLPLMKTLLCSLNANRKFGVQGGLFLESKALTKVQSAGLIAIVLVAAVGGGTAYMLWIANQPPTENIRIGVLADLDMPVGKDIYQGALLAAEQANAEGGILGRNVTIVAEDDDSITGGDQAVASNALTRLLTVDEADYVIAGPGAILVQQDICSEHKKILFSVWSSNIEHTQRVLDDYDKYKYFFRIWFPNSTAFNVGHVQGLAALKNLTGFTKIGYLLPDSTVINEYTKPFLESELPKLGFEIVYRSVYVSATTDFASYLAAAEASGVEILFIINVQQSATVVSLIKEWYDRQAPFVVWGDITAAADLKFWNLTEGKTEYVAIRSSPTVIEYPLTSKTLVTRKAYLERWGTVPTALGVSAYDVVRFILPDAVRRAGTTETEAVIKTLETANVETSMAGRFAFTSSHDIMVGEAGVGELSEQYMLYMICQWQNGTLVPVFPNELRIAAGATYKFPPWQGAWSD